MSRVFTNLIEAGLEIRRDLKKGTSIEYSRVQQHVGQSIPGRERMGYEYVIMDGGIPTSPSALIEIGQRLGLDPYLQLADDMHAWLVQEIDVRLFPEQAFDRPLTDLLNPLLANTALEGGHPAYTYRERLMGAVHAMAAAVRAAPDTRRAYWPIFLPQDAYRAGYPTRVPCSLGYEVMLRNVDGRPRLQVFYLQRACDFDRFWLSDVWFAYRFGHQIAQELEVPVGAFYHYILSLHSFDVELEEVY
jgi:hypothetical protein